MTKKIVAIGGGENGRIKSDGTQAPYETESIDKEIIKLTGKVNPNFLFIAHAQLQSLDVQDFYFKTMKNIYNGRYNCECKMLRSDKINDIEYVQKLIDWADIIYEGGGNTFDMIEFWKKTGFDKVLKKAWENGKVLCGISAGASCWFEECVTDSLKYKSDDKTLISMECLGFQKGFFSPHSDELGRKEAAKNLIKDKVGILLSNCSALEIIDEKYRIITSDSNRCKPFALKTYYKEDKYIEEELDLSLDFKDIKDLYKK